MKQVIILLVLTLLASPENKVFAQSVQGKKHSEQQTGQPPYPIQSYQELPNPIPVNDALWQGRTETLIGWGTTDIRYKKEEPAPFKKAKTKIELSAWRGERVAAQFVVSAYKKPIKLSFEVSDLINTENPSEKISQSSFLTGFVRYVMTDELNKDGKGACGQRKATDFDSTLVADPIDHLTKKLEIEPKTTQAGWVRIWVPENTKAGKYRGTVTLKDGKTKMKELQLSVSVSHRQLPAPKDWAFHLDLWQNPYAVARYYQAPLWSPEHFKALKETIQSYADAGGKVITASIMNKPWNGQTYDAFHSMVTWTKELDGSWSFDYSVFDRWVQFMMELGVDQQINCYSMVPWRLSFDYFDSASNTIQTLKTKPGEPTYEKLWTTMLTSFSKHLKEKGWFDKTYIAMDERPMETMQETIKVIKKADPDFKIAFAGSLHKELFGDIDDYSLSLDQKFSDVTIKQRKKEGKTTTFYTSCSQPRPNSFTFSKPAEAAWYGWHAADLDLDGYLRWAYNSWVSEPLLDSRFITWAAGDTYFVYPGGRTSIRFEKLVEGIQAYEKVQILKKEFKKTNNQKALQKLQKTLEGFSLEELDNQSAAELVQKGKRVLNSL